MWVRYLETILGLMFIPALCWAGRAQSTQQNDQPNSEITLEPDAFHAGVPHSFTVFLTNTTAHVIRLPRPTLFCRNTRRGSILLAVSYKPLRSPGHLIGQSCIVDSLISKKPILDQIALWETLLPGHSLRLQMTTRDPAAITRPGTYTISASYKTGFLLPAERTQLALHGIDVPNADLTSAKLTYIIPMPERKPR